MTSEEHKFLKRSDDGEEVYEFRTSRGIPQSSFKTKLIFWSVIIGGIAVGTVLFLFFLAVFFYVILPLLLIASLWTAFKFWRFRSKWRR